MCSGASCPGAGAKGWARSTRGWLKRPVVVGAIEEVGDAAAVAVVGPLAGLVKKRLYPCRIHGTEFFLHGVKPELSE